MKLIQILIIFLILKITTIFGILKTSDCIKAIVNNNIILNSDIENKIKIMQCNSDISTNISHFQDTNLYNTVLDQLITDNLMIQIAKKNNIQINQNKINKIISSIANYHNMTVTQFKIYLKKNGLDYHKYYLEIYHHLLKKKVYDYIIHQYNHSISPQEINNTVQQLNFINFDKKFKLTQVIIDVPISKSSSENDTSKNLAKLIIQQRMSNQSFDAIIKKYYKNHILPHIRIKEPTWDSWNNIPAIFDPYLKTAKKGDIIGPLQLYDEIHILEIQDICIKKCIFPVIKVKFNEIISKDISSDILIEQQLLKIKQNIENANTTFSMIIKDTSLNFYSNNYGDSIQWINIDHVSPSIKNTLLSLKKGQISMPIYTDNGWCLIKLIDIDKLNYSEIIYERSYSYLLQKKIYNLLNNWITELKSKSYIKIIN